MRFLYSFLLAALLAIPAQAQTTSADKKVNEEDKAKAKIWCAALQWIYDDNNLREQKTNKAPSTNCSSTAEFEKSLEEATKTKKDPYKFHDFFKKTNQGGNDFDEAALIALIVEAAKKADRNTDELKIQLERVAGLTPENETPDSATEKDTATFDAAANSVATNQPLDGNAGNGNNTSKDGFPYWLGVTTLMLAGLSFLTSIYLLLNRTPSSQSQSDKTHLSPKPIFNSTAITPQAELKRQGEIKLLEDKIASVNLRLAELESLARTPAIVEVAPIPVEEPQAQPVGKVVKSVKKYARLPEEEWIKSKDIMSENNIDAFIELTINESNSEKASFRINPESNHTMAINNSGERLKTFFDFNRSYEVVSKIINLENGKLIKTAQGWKIEKKAKISFE